MKLTHSTYAVKCPDKSAFYTCLGSAEGWGLLRKHNKSCEDSRQSRLCRVQTQNSPPGTDGTVYVGIRRSALAGGRKGPHD